MNDDDLKKCVIVFCLSLLGVFISPVFITTSMLGGMVLLFHFLVEKTDL